MGGHGEARNRNHFGRQIRAGRIEDELPGGAGGGQGQGLLAATVEDGEDHILALGAMAGAAAANANRQPQYVPSQDPNAVAYCARTYRSYNPNTGTYTGYDGLQHPCP